MKRMCFVNWDGHTAFAWTLTDAVNQKNENVTFVLLLAGCLTCTVTDCLINYYFWSNLPSFPKVDERKNIQTSIRVHVYFAVQAPNKPVWSVQMSTM